MSRFDANRGEVYHYAPQPFVRSGPGTALDGKPKFDLTRLDQAYFDRLRSRVVEAGSRRHLRRHHALRELHGRQGPAA